MKLRVTPVEGEPFDFELELENGSVVVGRSSTADLALADPHASRHHARLTRRGESLQVEDLGSRNGTFLNERPVVGIVEVGPGDRIRVAGSFLLRPHEGPHISSVMTRGSVAFAGFPDTTLVRPAAELLEESSDSIEVYGGETLRKHVVRLKTLRGIHRAFSRATGRADLLRTALGWAFDLFSPGQGAIYLRASDGELRRAERRPTDAASDIPLPVKMVAQVMQERLAVAAKVDPPPGDPSVASSSLSLIAAPLLDGDRSFGMLVLSRDHPWPFPEEQLDLLVELAGEAALEIRKLAFAEEAEKGRLLEYELALARGLQNSILPDELPAFAGYSSLSHNAPSRVVSGDFYKMTLRQGGEECVLFMGDVSGKGFSAALVTVYVEALAAAMIEAGSAPEEICSKLSQQLSERMPRSRFVTAFVAVLDRESGRCTYTNAGQSTALLARPGGTVEELKSFCFPLALWPSSVYEAREVLIEPGATLLLYTDGITEAATREDAEDQYGLERLKACFAGHCDAALPEVIEAIQADLGAFVGDMPYADDRTILIVRRSALLGQSG